MPILSVIIPVYNVSHYLKDGLNSILSQQVKDIEVICINDASTDDSLDILYNFQRKDNRVIIYNNDINKGVSFSRNMGIFHSNSKYIVFFDPDDTVEIDMYSKLIDTIEDTNIDIVMCGFKTLMEGKITIPNFIPNEISNPYDFIRNNKTPFTNGDFCYPWHLIFRRSLISKHKLQFNEKIHVGEDTVFNFEAIMNSRLVTLIPLPLYNYRIDNPNSMMKQKYNPYLEDSLQIQVKEKKKIIKKYNIDDYSPITKDMSEDIIERYTLMMLNNLKNNPNAKNKYNEVRRIVNMPMIKEAAKIIGFRNIYQTWKEYLFYLAIKFRMSLIVYKLYFK